MQLAILLLLVAALALLVLSLIGGNTTLAIFSIAVSVVAVGFVVRGRRQRQELAAQRLAEADRQAKIEADKDETTRVLAAATAEASRQAAAATEVATSATGPATAPAAAPATEPATAPAAAPVTEPSLAPAAAVEAGEPEPDLADEPPAADTVAPLERYGQSRVWVIDGRPRYHLAECGALNGSVPEPIPLAQAVEDGFTPCSTCDPDNKVAG